MPLVVAELVSDGFSKPMCVSNTFFVCHVCKCEIPEGAPVFCAHDKYFCSRLHRDRVLKEFWPWHKVFYMIYEDE